jgi:glycosyltransferase involved in cell wall biosynthesis
MRILLSAYACEPGKGSEPGVGWHWATELARLGHEVAVITRSNNRPAINKALEESPICGLRFYYYDLPSWSKWWKYGNRGIYLYYWLWQRGAYHLARQLTHRMQFDLVHHLTFGVFRQPSFMGRLGLPFVVGPIGGGEFTPKLLRYSFPAKEAFQEMLREISNKLAFWNPSLCGMLRQASLIFCKTRQTLDILPATCRMKSCVQLEIGLEPRRIRRGIVEPEANANFLYAGRLVYWKGLHLALKALAELKKYLPNATLTIIGTGSSEKRLKQLSAKLGLQDSVRWLGWIPHEEMWAQYCRYTAFVFPSLHDSSGNVLLEALSQALPVICLDTGGPGTIIPPLCGIKVPVKNRCEVAVVKDLSAAMQRLANNPELRAQMGCRALDFASANTWKDVVSSAYAQIHDSVHTFGTYTVLNTDRTNNVAGVDRSAP